MDITERDVEPAARTGYAPPTITDLGTLHELTMGGTGPFSDGTGSASTGSGIPGG